jgi:NADP-dependent 3-hydroxy acid dehydrogenase YdfG
METKGLAIVTGATKGIGYSVSKGLAEDGYRVVLLARNIDGLMRIHDEIKKNKYQYDPIVMKADITDYSETEQKIKEIANEYGPIDILVNSAAMFLDGSLNESIENYKKIIDTNVVAQYGIMKTVVDIMKKENNGYIFNIASRAGKYGFSGGGIYGSTKFALIGLTESLYRELSPHGIRFTSLCPGWVNTEMAKESGTPFQDDEMIQPDDILNTIRYLLNLSRNVCIKEIVIEMKKSII